MVPEQRILDVNGGESRRDADYVVYWMIAQRRPLHNFGLQRAVEWAAELELPLVVLEALRCDYRWASDRHHAFVIQGMRENASWFARRPVLYHAYVEPERGAGKGLLEALAERAAVVVTDDYPCFFLPRMVEAAGGRIGVKLEAVDSCGLMPVRATDKRHLTAHSFRRHLQRSLGPQLVAVPEPDPLEGQKLPRLESLPARIGERWPHADEALLATRPEALAGLPIDHDVPPTELTGGFDSGAERLREFLDARLGHYAEERNHPDADAASGLSPWLHFGHVSPHQVLAELADRNGWTPGALSSRTDGARSGWWGMDDNAEAFLDQLVTWRELGFNAALLDPELERYGSLPEWARQTLAEHAADEREYSYGREQFERAETHEELWNAAQRQLLAEGVVHNYLRMIWGKMILGWSASPEQALETMVELNNRWALDGRDPNSYSGIFWCLGRYDRPWGPERPVFGKVRYMTCANTRRKLRLDEYLERWS